ncbi:MAG: double-strand break repair protein AddB, partial [Acetobacter sp.]|uniref:double-strand break repair protein AddB n=3 Tax=Acetobacter sp. TaxID=440 RepID=UPI0039EA8D93
MKLASIPAHLPFLDQLAARWIAAAGHDREAMGHGVIVLPGRRAARALTEAFLRQMDGGGMLLPRIMPIGALDEAELGLSVSSPSPGLDDADRMEPDEAYDRACGPLTLPPAVGGMTRLATLTRLILQAEGAFGTRPTLDQAWPLANALAELMDEAEWAGITLAERLPDAVQDNFAEHWQIILRFLSIVTHAWPAWLREQGVMNPVARQVALLGAQARVWRGMARRGDATRLWAAGFTHVMAPLGHALRAVSACPGGMIILPGLDMDMPGEVFDTLPDSHPQAGMAHLLAVLEATRADVEPWPASGGNPARAAMLARVMLPAQALGDWTRDVAADATVGVTVGATVGATTGVAQGSAAAPGQVQRIEAQDEQEEALAISMIMRDAIETPGHTVALVTPDRALAARVSTELARWGVVADDSAGLALSSTPVAVLLRLIARMVDSGFSPVALLSVLKHPLVACGLSVGTCRASARLLERMVLRGPAPAPGFAALRMAVEDTLSARNRHAQTDTAHTADRPFGPEPLPAFMDRLAFCFEPVLGWTMDQPRAAPGPQARAHQAPLPDLLAGLLAVAERLARTDEEDGPARLWRGEDGNLLAERLGELMLAADILPPQPPVVLDGLLGAVLTQDRAVTRRADPTALHPRVLIWGLFEARLQTAQTVILGGLSEGTWPPVTDAGPWMSRPMRRKVGLPSPELAVGQAAHDFYATVAAAGQVILSCPRRREGAPVVPARWLTRLDAFLAGRGARVPAHPVLAWLRQLDQPPGAAN